MMLRNTMVNRKGPVSCASTISQVDSSSPIESTHSDVETGVAYERAWMAESSKRDNNHWLNNSTLSDESLVWLDSVLGLDGSFYLSAQDDVYFGNRVEMESTRIIDHAQHPVGSNLTSLADEKSKKPQNPADDRPTQISAASEVTKVNKEKRKTRRIRTRLPRPARSFSNPRESGDLVVGDVDALRTFCEGRFEVLLVKACKPVGANIVNLICPFKTHDYPYWNAQRPADFCGRPIWWPCDIEYTSPHHMRKPELFKFLSYLVAMPLTDPENYKLILERHKDGADWETLLKKAVPKEYHEANDLLADTKSQPPSVRRDAARLRVFHEIFYMVGMAAKWADGEIDNDYVIHHGPVPDECFLRSKNGVILSENYNKGRSKTRRTDMDISPLVYAASERGESELMMERGCCPCPEMIQESRKKRQRLTTKPQHCADNHEPDSINESFFSSPPQLSLPESILNGQDYSFAMGVNDIAGQADAAQVAPLEGSSVGSTTWCCPDMGQQQDMHPTNTRHSHDTTRDLECLDMSSDDAWATPSRQNGQGFGEFVNGHTRDAAAFQCNQQWPYDVRYNAAEMHLQRPSMTPRSYVGSWPGLYFAVG